MKKLLAFVSLVLCFSLLLSVNSLALGSNSQTTFGEITLPEGYGIWDNHLLLKNSLEAPVKYLSPSNSSITFNKQDYIFGKLLGFVNRAFYDSLVNITPKDTNVTVDFGRELTEDEFKELNVYYIWDALLLDCPHIFWLTSMKITYSIREEKVSVLKKNKFYSGFNVELVFDPAYENPQKTYDELWAVVENLNFKVDNRYDLLKAIHDYLANKITYGGDSNSPKTYDPVGALIDGLCVCQGYAESFKMICDYYKIPSICVIGEAGGGNHMWNAVKMDNGYWYLMDVTWDDQEETIYNDFFLTGLSTEAENFNTGRFCDSHEMIYQHKYNSLLVEGLTLEYPALSYLEYSTERYSKYTEFSASRPINTDTERKIVYFSVFSDLDAVYYNGLWIPSGAKTTKTEITVNSGENSETEKWTLGLYGDLNCDGACSVEDLSVAVNKALEQDFDENDLIDVLADANNDKVIDVLDVMAYEMARTGYYKF